MSGVSKMAVVAIAFLWLGLILSPGAGPDAEIVKTGLVGTVAAAAGFTLVGYVKRDRSAPGSRRSAPNAAGR